VLQVQSIDAYIWQRKRIQELGPAEKFRMIERRERKEISSLYQEKHFAATGKCILFHVISNFVDCNTLYKQHVFSERTGNIKMCLFFFKK
jgi:hypothetical protein